MTVPVMSLNCSPARWYAPPWPAEANDSLSGFAFASLIRSASVLYGDFSLTSNRIGPFSSMMIGVRSFAESNGICGISALLTDSGAKLPMPIT